MKRSLAMDYLVPFCQWVRFLKTFITIFILPGMIFIISRHSFFSFISPHPPTNLCFFFLILFFSNLKASLIPPASPPTSR